MVAISDISTITFRSDQGSDSNNITGVVHGIRYIDDGTPSPVHLRDVEEARRWLACA